MVSNGFYLSQTFANIMNITKKIPCCEQKTGTEFKLIIFCMNQMSIFTGIEDLFEGKTKLKECTEKESASEAYYSLINLTYSDGRQDMITSKIAISFPCLINVKK